MTTAPHQMVHTKTCKLISLKILRNNYCVSQLLIEIYFLLTRYVIKAVVYEIGILTEVADGDNSTEDEDFS